MWEIKYLILKFSLRKQPKTYTGLCCVKYDLFVASLLEKSSKVKILRFLVVMTFQFDDFNILTNSQYPLSLKCRSDNKACSIIHG